MDLLYAAMEEHSQHWMPFQVSIIMEMLHRDEERRSLRNTLAICQIEMLGIHEALCVLAV